MQGENAGCSLLVSGIGTGTEYDWPANSRRVGTQHFVQLPVTGRAGKKNTSGQLKGEERW